VHGKYGIKENDYALVEVKGKELVIAGAPSIEGTPE